VSRRLLRIAPLLVLGTLVLGCARHDAAPAFRRALLIDDRGISVPLPPPSLVDEPVQEVDVDAQSMGEDRILAGTVAHVVDVLGDATLQVELDADAEHFELQGLIVDLRENCLELWLVAPDGRESSHVFVHASIASETEIETVVGCDES